MAKASRDSGCSAIAQAPHFVVGVELFDGDGRGIGRRLGPIGHELHDAAGFLLDDVASPRRSAPERDTSRPAATEGVTSSEPACRVASAYATMPSGPKAETSSIISAKNSGRPKPTAVTVTNPRVSHAQNSPTGSGGSVPPRSRNSLTC